MSLNLSIQPLEPVQLSTPRQAATCKTLFLMTVPPAEPLFTHACLKHAARADFTFSSGHCVSDFSYLKLLCDFSQLCLTWTLWVITVVPVTMCSSMYITIQWNIYFVTNQGRFYVIINHKKTCLVLCYTTNTHTMFQPQRQSSGITNKNI
jgi:hypothetical protein